MPFTACRPARMSAMATPTPVGSPPLRDLEHICRGLRWSGAPVADAGRDLHLSLRSDANLPPGEACHHVDAGAAVPDRAGSWPVRQATLGTTWLAHHCRSFS